MRKIQKCPSSPISYTTCVGYKNLSVLNSVSDAVPVDISTMDHWQWSLGTKLHTDLTAQVVIVMYNECQLI